MAISNPWTVAAASQGVNTLSITIPSAGTAAVGDFAAIFVTSLQSGVPTPSGWNLVAPTGGATFGYVFTKTLVSADLGAAVSIPCGSGAEAVGVAVGYRGASNFASVAGYNQFSLTAPTATAKESGDWLICLFNTYSASTAGTLTIPSGMTSDINAAGSIGVGAELICHLSLSSSGATGTKTATSNLSASDATAISFVLYELPVVTVTAPTGTNTDEDVTIQWTVWLPAGETLTSHRAIVYTAAQQAAPGFSAGTSPSTWDSGTVASSATSAAPVGLPNFGGLWAWIEVTGSNGDTSFWASTTWSQAVELVAIEIGFNASTSSTNFILNDPVRGVLNNTTYTLGGTAFVDVTAFCSGVIAVQRGRSRETDQYQTGTLAFTLRNENRDFDPTNTSSPYYPGIVPRAPVNCYVAGILVFSGYIDDYNVDYQKPSICTVAVTATDALAILANAYINDWSANQELTGQRLLDILSQNVPSFPSALSIAPGQTTVQSNIFGQNTGGGGQGDIALDDMQNIAASEWGFLFADRQGTLTFLDRYAIVRQLAAGTNYATFSDNATDQENGAFPYSEIGVVSATLLLYNEVQGTRNSNANVSDDQPITQIAQNAASQDRYLIRTLSLPTVQNYEDSDVLSLCNWVLGLYAQPEVRFDTLEVVDLQSFTTAQLQTLAALDITDLCTVNRTPPGGGSPTVISLASYIDQISWHFDVSASTAKMGLSFGSGDIIEFFVLNSSSYGVLNQNALAY